MAVGQPQQMLLCEFGDRVRAVFGEMAYHVGSSLEKKEGWRDVDVRVMLSDDQWNTLELGDPDDCHHSERWRALCIVFSHYGRSTTGLPIDFQLQHVDHANADYGDRPRSALFTANRKLVLE